VSAAQLPSLISPHQCH